MRKFTGLALSLLITSTLAAADEYPSRIERIKGGGDTIELVAENTLSGTLTYWNAGEKSSRGGMFTLEHNNLRVMAEIVVGKDDEEITAYTDAGCAVKPEHAFVADGAHVSLQVTCAGF